MPTTTGPDLRAERKRINTQRAAKGMRDITVTAIARQMGLSRQTVHGIENASRPARASEYLAALQSLRDDSVSA